MGGRARSQTAAASVERPDPERVRRLLELLQERWPDAIVELDHTDAYQLLTATILAAQSNDKTINTLTPALFAKYPDPRALAEADLAELEPMIYKSGFFRMKAKHIVGTARAIVERHEGVVPDTMEALVELPGVARKTANVLLGSVFGKNEGIVVDTHVTRLGARLGLTANVDPVKIENDLMAIVPRATWNDFAHQLIWHGRRVCTAPVPQCDQCVLVPVCPSAFTITAATGNPQAKGKGRADWNKAAKKPAKKGKPSAATEPKAGTPSNAKPSKAKPPAAKPAKARKPKARPPTKLARSAKQARER